MNGPRERLMFGGSEDWLAARALRNRMVHEYIRRPEQLADAVTAAHAAVALPVVSNLTVLTRDSNPYRTSFARLEVVSA